MQIIFGMKRPPHWRRNLALQKDEIYQEAMRREDFPAAQARIRELGWELSDEPPRDHPILPRKQGKDKE